MEFTKTKLIMGLKKRNKTQDIIQVEYAKRPTLPKCGEKGKELGTYSAVRKGIVAKESYSGGPQSRGQGGVLSPCNSRGSGGVTICRFQVLSQRPVLAVAVGRQGVSQERDQVVTT